MARTTYTLLSAGSKHNAKELERKRMAVRASAEWAVQEAIGNRVPFTRIYVERLPFGAGVTRAYFNRLGQRVEF